MELKLTNVSKQFGNYRAVAGVDLTLKKGEIFTILGASGSGKTTVLRMIAGFETPSGGEITLGGRVVSDTSVFIPPEERSAGLVFQDLALFPHMTVEKNILYAMKEKDYEELDTLLSLCKLTSLRKRYPHEISGGEMQRVALARALAGRPDILLLDEPFNNLDILLKESLLRDIKRIIKSRGVTALFVTHHKDEAYFLSDRIAIMKKGEIQQKGTPLEVYHNPETPYTASFLGKVNLLTAEENMGFVRPEEISLTPSGENKGIITDVVFQGHYTELTIELENSPYRENSLTVHAGNAPYKQGDRVGVCFSRKLF